PAGGGARPVEGARSARRRGAAAAGGAERRRAGAERDRRRRRARARAGRGGGARGAVPGGRGGDSGVRAVSSPAAQKRSQAARRPARIGGAGADTSIGARLREQRDQLGLSLRELARRLEVSPSLVSQIETGKIQ